MRRAHCGRLGPIGTYEDTMRPNRFAPTAVAVTPLHSGRARAGVGLWPVSAATSADGSCARTRHSRDARREASGARSVCRSSVSACLAASVNSPMVMSGWPNTTSRSVDSTGKTQT